MPSIELRMITDRHFVLTFTRSMLLLKTRFAIKMMVTVYDCSLIKRIVLFRNFRNYKNFIRKILTEF